MLTQFRNNLPIGQKPVIAFGMQFLLVTAVACLVWLVGAQRFDPTVAIAIAASLAAVSGTAGIMMRRAIAEPGRRLLLCAGSYFRNNMVQLGNPGDDPLERLAGLADGIDTLRHLGRGDRDQVLNSAVSQMDQVTQQNAALVEETTAAAHASNRESEDLCRLVASFETGHASGQARSEAPGRARRSEKPEPRTKFEPPRARTGRPPIEASQPIVHGNLARKLDSAAAAPAEAGWEQF
jgi:hypothetical protein